MAITKILARKGRLDIGIRYVLNGDKTQEQVLTARMNCEPGREVRQMLETKRDYGKEDGVQYYHMILSFRPDELTPELALDIAREFAEEHLPGYQAVIGVHVDKAHIHAHILFNSVKTPSTRTPARSITATPGATISRSGPFRTGCAWNTGSLLSCVGNRPKR